MLGMFVAVAHIGVDGRAAAPPAVMMVLVKMMITLNPEPPKKLIPCQGSLGQALELTGGCCKKACPPAQSLIAAESRSMGRIPDLVCRISWLRI